MDSRNCQTFYASPAKPGGLLRELAGKVGFGLAFPYFTVHGFLQALSVL